MPERIVFKGKTPTDISNMEFKEFLTLIKSNNRRWFKRNSLQFKQLNKKVEASRAGGKMIKTHVREAVIIPSFIGLTFGVYNGKEFVTLKIEPFMIGHRLGEYSYTTKRVQHSAPGIKATRGSKNLEKK